jgi:NAD dependent epimerase/dehydratase
MLKLKGTKVLLTGAGGFIGSHLSEVLVRQGARVRALVHYNSRNDWGLLEEIPIEVKGELDVVPGDVRDPFLINSAVKGCEIVFHLASLIAIPFSYRAPSSYVETNVQGTLNVLQACLVYDVSKVIHTSTSEVYGSARYIPIDEEHPLRGQSPYAASKIAADKLAESFQLSYGLPLAIIRPFNTYGPRQSARAIIPTIISQALSRDRLELGLLSPVRDLSFVRDTVDGFVKMAESEDTTGKVINIGSGLGITIGDLANRIMGELGVEKEVLECKERLRPPESEVMNLVCDNRKAKEILGWAPCTTLEEGLQETIEYCTRNLTRYKTGVYNV